MDSRGAAVLRCCCRCDVVGGDGTGGRAWADRGAYREQRTGHLGWPVVLYARVVFEGNIGGIRNTRTTARVRTYYCCNRGVWRVYVHSDIARPPLTGLRFIVFVETFVSSYSPTNKQICYIMKLYSG